MNKKRWVALWIAVGLFAISVVSQIGTTVATTDFENIFRMAGSEFEERVIEDGTSLDKIAVLRLNGAIVDGGAGSILGGAVYNHQRFLRTLDHVAEDPNVEAVILEVNSPGGGVVESAEIYKKIVKIQEEYGKPVYVSMGNMAASGGYYVSASADKIVAHPGTLTGSIGVIIETLNFSQLAENLGIDFNTLTSGEYKDIMSSTREMTDEERALLQEMVDEMYADFVDAIVAGRGMPEDTVRTLADGRIYTGSQAKENGLIDDLGNIDETIAMLKEDYGLENATVIEYVSGLEFNQFLGMTAQNLLGENQELQVINQLLRESNAPRAMYLYSE